MLCRANTRYICKFWFIRFNHLRQFSGLHANAKPPKLHAATLELACVLLLPFARRMSLRWSVGLSVCCYYHLSYGGSWAGHPPSASCSCARGLLLAAAPRNDWGNYQLPAGMAKFSRLAFAGSHYWISLVFSLAICTIWADRDVETNYIWKQCRW